MPYEGEFAKYEAVRRIVSNPRVREFLENCEKQSPDVQDGGPRVEAVHIERPRWSPDYVIAIDGSHQETPVKNGFPGAEISYLTVACVILDVAQMRTLDAQRPADPAAFNDIKQAEAIDAVFPGSNVALKGDQTPLMTLRHQLTDTLRQNQLFEDGETVLETYETLLAHAGYDKDFPCPNPACKDPGGKARRGPLSYVCHCAAGYDLLSTDALRIHVGMAEGGPNGAMFAEISQCLEHLWLLNLLRSIEAKGWLGSLKRIGIFMDGPLGVFGHPAWLSQAISKELRRLNDIARAQNGEDLMLIGIEKSGAFATHLQMLDTKPSGEPNRYPASSLFLLNNEYIKKRIQMSVPMHADASQEKAYGKDTYYGRKFLYKTKTGALIVGVLPFLRDGDDDLSRADADQYPRIGDALNLLDDLVSARYPNAVVPIIEAHAEAAIPLNMGARVLESLAQSLIKG